MWVNTFNSWMLAGLLNRACWVSVRRRHGDTFFMHVCKRFIVTNVHEVHERTSEVSLQCKVCYLFETSGDTVARGAGPAEGWCCEPSWLHSLDINGAGLAHLSSLLPRGAVAS